jgi:hypothetical protein
MMTAAQPFPFFLWCAMKQQWDGPWSGPDATYWQLHAGPVHAALYKKRAGVVEFHRLKPFKERYYLDSNIGCLPINAKTDVIAKQIALVYLRKQIARASEAIMRQ